MLYAEIIEHRWDLVHAYWTEPVFVILLRSPGIDCHPGGPVPQPYLSYRPARLHRPAESIPRNRFLGSLNVYKPAMPSDLFRHSWKISPRASSPWMPRNFDPELSSVVQVLLPARDPGQGGRSAPGLSVCRRSQDGWDRGGGVQWILTQQQMSLANNWIFALPQSVFLKITLHIRIWSMFHSKSKKRFLKSSPALRKILYIMVKS